MTPAELYKETVDELNRPEDDDRRTPEAVFLALRKEEERIRELVAMHHPTLLEESVVLTTSSNLPASAVATDGTFWLPDYPLPGLQVYEPPGRPRGPKLPPKLTDLVRPGFTVYGKKLVVDPPRTSSIYVYLTRQSGTLEKEADSSLPSFLDDLLIVRAARRLAGKLNDPTRVAELTYRVKELWEGDPMVPSDTGILGRLKRMADDAPLESADYDGPWYWGLP